MLPGTTADPAVRLKILIQPQLPEFSLLILFTVSCIFVMPSTNATRILQRLSHGDYFRLELLFELRLFVVVYSLEVTTCQLVFVRENSKYEHRLKLKMASEQL